jgi:hypothetical protein
MMQQAPSRARGGAPDDTVEEFHPLQVGMQLQEAGRNSSMQKGYIPRPVKESVMERIESGGNVQQCAIAEPDRSTREVTIRLDMLIANIVH